MSSASPEYGWTRWMEGYDRDVQKSNPHRMFTSIDPPHELFLDKLKMKPLENIGQAAGAYLNLLIQSHSDALVARQLEERILAEGAKNVAAFVFEPVQGRGGAVDMHHDFFPLAEEICKKYSILMISDETLSFVKTGHWFGMEMYGVCPDIVVLGDGLTCGKFPAGAIISRNEIFQTAFKGLGTKLALSDSWHHDFTGSSYPICSASALHELDMIDNENLLELCASRGKEFIAILKSELEGLSFVEQIRGTGLIIGVDLTSQIALDVEERLLLEHNILLGRSINKHCLLLMPPCAMPNEQFEKIAKALKQVLGSFSTIVESTLRKKRNS
jgi:adenosylmethionine-8-amino-7-oxononanoate aminotransferase